MPHSEMFTAWLLAWPLPFVSVKHLLLSLAHAQGLVVAEPNKQRYQAAWQELLVGQSLLWVALLALGL